MPDGNGMRSWKRFAVVAALAMPCLASAAVTRVEITRRQPFAGGEVYGSAGAYERIRGRFHGELDPADAANAGIVDIERAPRNARGRVEYSADFDILKPVDPARGNGTLFYEPPNRGNKLALGMFNNAAPVNDPVEAVHAGNGFLLRQGYTIAWSGWEPGPPSGANDLRIEVPRVPGLEQAVRDEIFFNTQGHARGRLAFEASGTDPARAALYVLDDHRSAPRLLPSSAWEYVDRRIIRLLPAGRAFPVGVIHQFVYPAANPAVSGIGFAATRDFVSFLRRDGSTANPLAAGGRPLVTSAIAHGNSQSGRYLRDFLYRGFNADEAGGIVFDGMNVHLAAARVDLNRRFAQPSRAFSLAYGFRGYGDVSFPFAYGVQKDPYSGKGDGILATCLRNGTCPKVMHTTTSSEYWQSGNSLVTTDPLGTRDETLPANVRVYQFASTQHSTAPTMPTGVCALPANLEVDPRPGMRALLAALEAWVKRDVPPPVSVYPTLTGGNLLDAAALRFPEIPGVVLPREANPRERFDGNDGLPRVLPGRYPVRVPAVDRDGNEIGGIRMPEVAAARGTATGWALRVAEAGGAGELCYLDGSYVLFARTQAERIARGDPRASLEERYPDRKSYVEAVRKAALSLRDEGYLLEEDIVRIVERAQWVLW